VNQCIYQVQGVYLYIGGIQGGSQFILIRKYPDNIETCEADISGKECVLESEYYWYSDETKAQARLDELSN